MWIVPRRTYDEMATKGSHDYVGRGEAVVVSGTTAHHPWDRCLPLAKLEEYFTAEVCPPAGKEDGGDNDAFLARREEVQCAPAEVSMQAPGDIQNSTDYPLDDLTGKSAMELLLKRRRQEESAGGVDTKRAVLYVKLPLGGSCPELLKALDLPSFLHRGEGHHGYQAVSHPIHLRPSTYFCWAYIGEKHTGSKTHVDILMSDAWLVVLSGRKRWAMVHPMDKHLVMDPISGVYANLFSIDHHKFPHAHKARLSIFEQNAGDAVFVPSDAPHCVENLDFSVSITYNFCAANTQHRWCCAMNRVMVATNASESKVKDVVDSGVGRTGIVDLFIFNRTLKKRVTLRGFVENLPCLPTTDYAIRVLCLKGIQQAFRVYGVLFEGLGVHINGIPIGCYTSQVDHRIVIHYEMPREDDFAALFQRQHGHLFCVEDCSFDEDVTTIIGSSNAACDSPQVIFPSLSSHFGPIPAYPPLSVLMWITPYTPSMTEPIFPLTALVTELGKYDHLRDNGDGDTTDTMWHYSRFPWLDQEELKRGSAPSSSPSSSSPPNWSCRTYLFYSSPDIHGPVCLHPLFEDGTLQTASDLSSILDNATERNSDSKRVNTERTEAGVENKEEKTSSSFDPHFEEFEVRRIAANKQQQPALLYNLSTDLIQQIACTLFLTKEVDGLLRRAEAHGLKTLPGAATLQQTSSPSSSFDAQYKHIFDIGLEKLMVLALWFSCQSGVVGFTYSHTFSAVEEPGTICLTGSAADSLLARVPTSTKALSLTTLCNLLDPPSDSPPNQRELVRTAAKFDAVFDESIPRINVKRIVELKKNATGITCIGGGGGGEEGEGEMPAAATADPEEVAQRQQWVLWWTAIDAVL